MNLVLIRDGIKLKMLIELDPANDPADEASDLQEIAERFGFDTYDLEDAAPVQQAEQEPVAIDGLARACNLAGIDYKDFLRIKAYLPIAVPVRTKDLTDAEVEWLVVDTLETWSSKDTMKDFARAVIAKFKEKNNVK